MLVVHVEFNLSSCLERQHACSIDSFRIHSSVLLAIDDRRPLSRFQVNFPINYIVNNMPASSRYPIFELLLRHGIDSEIADNVSLNELRNFEPQEISDILKKIKRPYHSYRLFGSPPIKTSREEPFNFEAWWPSLRSKPLSKWVSPSRDLMQRSIDEQKALCYNATGEWSLRSTDYVALSHVWAEGLQRDNAHDGVPKAKLDLLFDVLKKRGIDAEWIWTDILAIPGGNDPTTSIENELLKINHINIMPTIYSNADAVVILDALVLQLHAENIVDVAVAILCGKWSTRVWTYQEIKLATNAVIVTATTVYNYGDVLARLTTLEALDSDRYRKLRLWFAIMQKNDQSSICVRDVAMVSRSRRSGENLDYARAFFPTLGLKWRPGMTREKGMSEIYRSQMTDSTRIAAFYGCPRLKERPGWAPSYLTGLEGEIREPLIWEQRGARGDWYAVNLLEIKYSFVRLGEHVFNIRVAGFHDQMIQIKLTRNEEPSTVERVRSIIQEGSAYILSSSSLEDMRRAEFAKCVLLVEKASLKESNEFEANVYCAALVMTPGRHSNEKLSVLLRHENPTSELGDLTNTINYYWHAESEESRPKELPIMDGESKLHAAVRSGDSSVVEILLSDGEPIESVDTKGWTPLHTAAARGEIEILRILLAKAPNMIEIEGKKEFNSETPLALAAKAGKADSIRLLINLGANVHARNSSGYTPIMIAASEPHPSTIDALLQNGANPNDSSPQTAETPLLVVTLQAGYRVLPTIQLLLDAGAEVDPPHKLNWTALHHAAEWGRPDAISLLLAKGANPNTQQSDTNLTPLYYAIKRASPDISRLLLDAGAERDTVFTGGMTPLHLAAMCGNYEIVQLLLEQPVEVNRREEEGGWTPLHLAATKGEKTMVKMLLKAGADVWTEDKWGRTALAMIKDKEGRKDMTEILEKAERDAGEERRNPVVSEDTSPLLG